MADVPQRLDLGLGLGKADPEAYFRRLALYSYAVAPLFPGRKQEGQYVPGLRQYAAGGRILQDEYPTSYLPEVGRQVMADGGVPLSPEDQRAMTHYESGPGVVEMAPVKFKEPLTGYERELFKAPAATAPVLEAGLEFAPYFTPAAPAFAARDVLSGLKHGDPMEVATAALGAPGKYVKAALVAGSAMMPSDAQATFFSEAARMTPAMREAFEAAKRATREGMSPRGSFTLHGAAPDPTGKIISEISDAPARLIPSGVERFRRGEQVSLGELLSHPEMYDLYPGSFSAPVVPFDRSPSYRGYFNQLKDELGSNVRLSDRDLLENLLHEHQHRVQHIEQMSPGTSPDVFPHPDRLAEPLKDDLKSANGAMALKAFMERNPTLKPIDAVIEARKAGIPLGPQPLKFSSLGQEELRNTQDLLSRQINHIYETTPDPYQQYFRSLGEVTARLPGERLEMTGPERRLNYPFSDESIIPRPASPAVIGNEPNPAWEKARADALALSRQLQESPLPPSLDDAVSPMEEALMAYAQKLEARKRAERFSQVGGSLPTIRKAGGGSTVKSALKMLGKLMPEGSGYASVPGKPSLVNLPGIGKVETRPIPEIESAASKYMQSVGRPGEHEIASFPEFNPAFATKVAEAFAEMKHRPGDPAVRRAYDALIDETMAQYRAAKDTGIDFRFLKEGQKDPYAASPALGYEDIVNRGRLFVFPTEQGFGSSGGLIADNPLLKRAGQVGDKPDAVVNDAFRIVHDLYGHFGPGNPFFRAPGEERAYQLHSRMFGPEALPAATLETRGQNSWLNYGPYGEANRSALGADTRFAEQKIGRMPEWTQAPAPAVGEDVEAYIRSLTGKAEGGEVERGEMAGGGLIKRALKAIEAYHGSPHSFDRFDISKVGTGEGAQAYGHGLYFAESEPVAKNYRDALAGYGKIVTPKANFDAAKKLAALEKKYGDELSEDPKQWLSDLAANTKSINDAKNYWLGEAMRSQFGKDVYNSLFRDMTGVKNTGSMYHVRINADPERFLDWDRPLAEQSATVQAALNNIAHGQPENSLGKDVIYSLIGGKPNNPNNFNNSARASNWLNEAGIPGIKYLDQGSRGAGAGSRNYVTFSDEPIEILRRYAEGGSVIDDAIRVSSNVANTRELEAA